jgi:hypothetical protein
MHYLNLQLKKGPEQMNTKFFSETKMAHAPYHWVIIAMEQI